MTESQLYVWDCTLDQDAATRDEVIQSLKVVAKKWMFQLEKGESGYMHWQIKFSLHKKLRTAGVLNLLWETNDCWNQKITGKSMKLTPSSNNGRKFTYVMKVDTRVEGPWADSDPEPPYIPRQVRGIHMWPWQQTVLDSYNVWDTRSINVIICPSGNIGKSTFVCYNRAHQLARPIPPVNDHKDMMRMVCDIPTAKAYLIDIPRAFNQDKMRCMWSAIETIKDGYAYDDRYSFKEKTFDCPVIWVFMNTRPDVKTMSTDRWKFYAVNNKKELEELHDVHDPINRKRKAEEDLS